MLELIWYSLCIVSDGMKFSDGRVMSLKLERMLETDDCVLLQIGNALNSGSKDKLIGRREDVFRDMGVLVCRTEDCQVSCLIYGGADAPMITNGETVAMHERCEQFRLIDEFLGVERP
jgi:hypothetical protein